MNLDAVKANWRRARESAVLYGAFGSAVRIGAQFVLLPLVLTRLSPAEQALWWLFLALGNFTALADFGFGPVITRVYSFLWAGADDFAAEGLPLPSGNKNPNFARLNELNSAVRYLYLRLSLLAMLLLGAAGTLLLLRPVREAGLGAGIWPVWLAYLGVIGYNLYTTHWVLACQGINRVREVQAANLWSSLGYLAAGVAFLLSGAGLFAMVMAMATRGVVSRVLCRRVYVRRPTCRSSDACGRMRGSLA
jgi:hypothetical protein